jgi:hypothetical protein
VFDDVDVDVDADADVEIEVEVEEDCKFGDARKRNASRSFPNIRQIDKNDNSSDCENF